MDIQRGKKLFTGSVPTSAGTAEYTVPTGYKDKITDIDVNNNSATALTLTGYFVPSGGSAGATNVFIPTITINPYTMFKWCGEQILNAGDFIQLVGSGSGLVAHISGEEIRVGI